MYKWGNFNILGSVGAVGAVATKDFEKYFNAGLSLVWVQWVQLHPQILRQTDFSPTDFEEI